MGWGGGEGGWVHVCKTERARDIGVREGKERGLSKVSFGSCYF